MKITEQQKRIITNTDFIATSDKYNPIATLDVINRFKEHGMTVNDLQESRTRLEHKKDKVRHFVRMKIDDVGGIQREVVIMNSSDSSTSLRLHAGLLRLVCNNGLVLSDDLIPAEKIKHTTKDPFARIDSFVDRLVSALDEESRVRALMEGRWLAAWQIEEFANKAIALREDDISKVLDPMAVNLIRRPEDAGHQLWEVFNRVQENLIQGDSYRKLGVTYDQHGEATEVYKAAKRLTDHTRIIKVNQDLHSLAMDYL